MEKRIIEKRYCGITAKLLQYIDSNAIRVYVDDKLVEASFEWRGINYIWRNNNLFKEEGYGISPVKINWVKSGTYPSYNISGIDIKAYVLAMLLEDVTFLDRYMSDKSLEVNHMLTEYSGKRICQIHPYRTNAVPVKEFAYNTDYLELVTRSQNRRHGNLIKKYGLYGIKISALDVESILDECDLEELNEFDEPVEGVQLNTDYYSAAAWDKARTNRIKVKDWLKDNGRV